MSDPAREGTGTLRRYSAGALDRTRDRAGRGANSACALGRGRTLLPARGLRRSRGWWSCCARWGAGTCRLEALHAEVRCLHDRALPGTSAWWEPKEGSGRGTGTLRGHPRPPHTVAAFFPTPAAGVPGKKKKNEVPEPLLAGLV